MFVLFNRHQAGKPQVLKSYATRKGALLGMRASNRNAGWMRLSRCWTGYTEMEWSKKDGEYEYAPYVFMHEVHYSKAVFKDNTVYLEKEVAVASLWNTTR